VKWVNTDQWVPIKSWCEDIEDGAMEQAKDMANHPAAFRHVAIMADGHRGYGVPIGGVMACTDAIIPFAVGSDIGCGMAAVKTTARASDLTPDRLREIMGHIRAAVPMGVGNAHTEDQPWVGFERFPKSVEHLIPNARKQLGTLGAGNHFIEIQADEDDGVWLMLHSGSRNLGYKIAESWHKKAVQLCEAWHSNIPCKELTFFPLHSIEGHGYKEAMDFALEYAKANRQLMLGRVMIATSRVLDCTFEEEINIHHNYAAVENHYGKNVVVHRKGATSARKGELGIIPGSMGTASYIVTGLGNRESFESCSHGAGRVMGRAQACRELTMEECNKTMEGIIFGRWGQDRRGRVDLSEAPQAYKNIDQVIASQDDLVEVVVKLRPLAAMKG